MSGITVSGGIVPAAIAAALAGQSIPGALTVLGNATITGGILDFTSNGGGVNVKEGGNARQNLVTLVAGTVTVADANVTANSRIFLTAQTVAGSQGILAITARVPGTSFTITSSNAADVSTVAYEIFEPG